MRVGDFAEIFRFQIGGDRLRHTADDEVKLEQRRHALVDKRVHGLFLLKRSTKRVDDLCADVVRPGKFLKIERVHRDDVHVSHRSGDNVLENRIEHGPAEDIRIVAVLHEVLDLRDQLLALLHLVKEDHRLPRDHPVAEKRGKAQQNLVRTLRPLEKRDIIRILDEIHFDHAVVVVVCELLDYIGLTDLTGADDHQRLFRVVLVELFNLLCDFTLEHFSSSHNSRWYYHNTNPRRNQDIIYTFP